MRVHTSLAVLTAVLGYLLLAPTAQAIHHLVFVSQVVKISDSDCAVELTISGDNQNAFVADDNIKLDGEILAGLAEAIDAGLNGSSGHNDTNDKVLAGSSTFNASHGIDVDLIFDDSFCAAFDADAVIGFFIDGSTPIDSINTASVAGFGGDNTAISVSNVGAAPTGVDLTSETVTVGNNAGATTTLGTAADDNDETPTPSPSPTPTPTTGGTGGCSLVGAPVR